MACSIPGFVGRVPVARNMGIPFWLALAWIALVVLCAAGAGLLPVPPPDQIDWANLAARPGVGGHLLGTDTMGRDILSRLLYGARVSLIVGVCAPAIGLFVGSLLGVVAGYHGGMADRAISGAIDTFLAFPRLVFLLMAMFVFGAGLLSLTLALGLVCAPAFARVARANTLKLAGREFVLAARAAGASDTAIILGEILPNVVAPLLVYMLLAVGLVIIAEGALGFLGLSVPAPTPSWGGMIAEGREALDQALHVSMIPTGVMFLTILACNLIGDRLRGAGSGNGGKS
jgi:peptide/nickel transport system permease protein